MTTPPILQRHPALRWLAPVGVVCVAAVVATGVVSTRASSTAPLPPTTPTALIAAVRSSAVEGFSGTVSSHLSLGLPALGGSEGATSFSSLLSGSHTLQVWYGGEDRERIALLGSQDETDLFRDGRVVWGWSSADRTATRAILPAPGPAAGPTRVTPLELARTMLKAVDRETDVRVEERESVADRPAYELVLTPRNAETKVGQVRISVDGETKVPLGVQVRARGTLAPSVDVSFTHIQFGRQPARAFRFVPPPDATVRQVPAASALPVVSVSGAGWTSVVELRPTGPALTALRALPAVAGLTPVSGAWGRGHLLNSAVLSALVTSDGRVFVGAVAPAALYAAAGK